MPTVTRTLATVFAAIALTVAGGSSAAADSQSIRVIEDTYEIDYGRGIRFSLEVASDAAPISEIRAFFTPLGPGSVTSYSYLDFEPGSTVLASFAISTAGSAYFPPGTPFEVRYRIADEMGNELETPPVMLEYLDPRFDWQKDSLGGITAIHHDLRDSEVESMLDAAAEMLPLIEETMGVEADGAYRGVVVNTRSEADVAFPFVSEASRNPHAFSGFAFARYSIFVLWGTDDEAFVHELSHLLLQEAAPSPIARVPAWLNEGLATYFETGGTDATRRRLQQVATRESLLPVRVMTSVPGVVGQIPMFYAKSGNFVGYLIERFGRSAVAELLARLDDGMATAEAIETVYGMSLDMLDAQWEAQFYGDPAPAAPTPEIQAAVAPAAPGQRDIVATPPEEAPSEPVVKSPGRSSRGLIFGVVLTVIAALAGLSFARRRLVRSRR